MKILLAITYLVFLGTAWQLIEMLGTPRPLPSAFLMNAFVWTFSALVLLRLGDRWHKAQ